MNTGIYKSFDELIEVIKAERDRLQKNLASIEGYEELGDVDVHLNEFKCAVLPRIQSLADSCIDFVTNSNIDEVNALEREASESELNKWSFRRLVNKYNHNYYCSRYLFHIAFLHEFSLEGLCQPIDGIYLLLSNLYNRCCYLVNVESINDDSLERFSILFHGMV